MSVRNGRTSSPILVLVTVVVVVAVVLVVVVVVVVVAVCHCQERQDVVENDHLVQTVQQTVDALESVQPRLSQNTRRRNSSRTTACPLSRIKVRPTALLRQHEPAGLLRCRWLRTRYAARVTPIHTSQHKTEINCQLVIQLRACYLAADVVTGET